MFGVFSSSCKLIKKTFEMQKKLFLLKQLIKLILNTHLTRDNFTDIFT